MFRTSSLFLALVVFSLNAHCVEPVARGFYVGGMGGITELDDDGLFQVTNFDDEDTGFAVFGGYKILKYLAVELRLSDLGDYSVDAGLDQLNMEFAAATAHVVGIIPFGTSGWEIFGQVGLGVVTYDIELDNEVGGDDDSSDEAVGSAGIGVRFHPMPNLALDLQIDAYAWEDDFGAGFGDYDFGIATTQFGVHYIF